MNQIDGHIIKPGTLPGVALDSAETALIAAKLVLGGDINGGTASAPLVTGLQGIPLDAPPGVANNNFVYQYDAAANAWHYYLWTFLGSVYAVSTSNVAALSGLPTMDGVALGNNQVVLLTAQSTASQNGLWITAMTGTGPWSRPTIYDSGAIVRQGSIVWAMSPGVSNGAAFWYMTGSTITTVDTDSSTWAKLSTGGGGATLPTDYISGCVLKYSSSTVIQVGAGSAYSTAAAGVVTIASTINNTPTLAASTLYYVYLASASTVEVTSTAPTAYHGTAWQGGTGGNRRYLGSFLTDASSHIVRFSRSGSSVFYITNIATSPFEVLGGGTATTATSVPCASVVPATSTTMLCEITVNDGGLPPTGSIGTSDNVPTTTTGNFLLGPVTGGAISWKGSAPIPLNASQAFQYILGSASSNVYVWCAGYMEDR